MRADADRHVTLVVPGLLGPLAAPASDHDEAARLLCEGLSPRALERFLGRATREPVVVAEEGLAATLFGCFGVSRSGPDWPVAAVTRSVDAGGVDPRWTLRVDPVHLRASMGELMLADDTALRVSAPEAAALVAEINAELGEPDLCIEALAPKRWYLCPQQPPRLVTRAPWDMVGVPIGANVPGGDDGARWRALVNDIQMILHASPVNRARESRGEAPVNSVWPWGGGCVPKLPPPAWQGVWADETLVEGLARLAGTPCRALPDDARDWLAQVDAPGGNLAGGDLAGGDLAGGDLAGRYLVIVSGGYVAARSSDVDGWRRFVERLERAWIAPLVDGLESGQLSSVALRTGGLSGFRLVRRRLRHWWRRPVPLARILASSRRLSAQQR
jgi:hypothetical protein